MLNYIEVDLSNRAIEYKTIGRDVVKLLRGGRGLNIYFLNQKKNYHNDPLSPENIIVIGAGLLTGSRCPSASRLNISSRSPESGFLADSSMGGFFGAQLKKANFSHIVISGKSSEPVYLLIENDRCSIESARDIWGQNIQFTQNFLKNKHGERHQCIAIGPAGENLVSFACLIHDKKSAAARTGLGCVFGSKKLKAIVVRGDLKSKLFDPDGLRECTDALNRKLERSKAANALRKHGTPFLFSLHSRKDIIRTRGFSRNHFPDDTKINSSVLQKNHYTTTSGCHGCIIQCRHGYNLTLKDGATLEGEGPDYGTLAAFGPICGNDDIESILELNYLVNDLGLDSISTGNLIGWAIQCFEQGLLDATDTMGLRLSFNNPELIVKMVKMIAQRQGFGDLLAKGTRFLIDRFKTAGEKIVQVKGLIQSDSVDVRPLKGFALGVGTSTRGADHLRSRPTFEIMNVPEEKLKEIYNVDISASPTSYINKAKMVYQSELDYALGDALGICRFAQQFNSLEHISVPELSKLIYYATGMEYSVEELRTVGERIITLERYFLAKLGITRASDKLPECYFAPQQEGSFLGEAINKNAYETMLDEYYRYHNWDIHTGIPSERNLECLGLGSLL